jgi:hypothetical protein
MRSQTIAVGVVLGLVACTQPYRRAEMNPPQSVFPGILDARTIKEQQSRVDLLVVHGMCHHDASWVDETVQDLARASGFSVSQAGRPPEALANNGELYFAELRQGDRTIGVYTVVWSPVSRPAKEELCYDVTKPTPSCPASTPKSKQRRAFLNALLKNTFLNDCLADAVHYLGSTGGARIRATMADALQRVGAHPTFLIAESLGSKIVFDTVAMELESTERRSQAVSFAENLERVYLLANQLPLLALGDSSGAPAPLVGDGESDSIAIVAKARAAAKAAKGRPIDPLLFVAYTDPNDLLSYAITDSTVTASGVEFIDVLVSNAYTYGNLIEMPTTAHTAYATNCQVTNSIFRGSVALLKKCK